MKNYKAQISAKSLIMLMLSALTLTIGTLCWFFMSGRNKVNDFAVEVDNPSSNFIFYEAIDTNKNGVIDNGEMYVEIENPDIYTENMVPGQTFFYKVFVKNTKNDTNFGLFFKDITDTNEMAQQIAVSASLVDKNGNVKASTNGDKVLSTLMTSNNETANAQILGMSDCPQGDYEVYYTLKLKTDTSYLYYDKTLSIDNVEASFYESWLWRNFLKYY